MNTNYTSTTDAGRITVGIAGIGTFALHIDLKNNTRMERFRNFRLEFSTNAGTDALLHPRHKFELVANFVDYYSEGIDRKIALLHVIHDYIAGAIIYRNVKNYETYCANFGNGGGKRVFHMYANMYNMLKTHITDAEMDVADSEFENMYDF